MGRRQRRIMAASFFSTILVAALAATFWAVNRARDPNLVAQSKRIQSDEVAQLTASPIKLVLSKSTPLNQFRQNRAARTRILPEDMGSGVAWGDVDMDGDWELYAVSACTQQHTCDINCSSALWTFESGEWMRLICGAENIGHMGMGASFADYDNDGDQDLYVTNYGPNKLYRNDGQGQFTDVTETAGVGDKRWSMGVAWGDIDRDGDLDLYVCNYVNFEDLGGIRKPTVTLAYEVPFTLNPSSYDPAPNSLFVNQGDGTFVEAAALYGLDNPDGRSLATTLVDLNGDGWLDLYVNNDVSTNRLFLNTSAVEGRLAFLDVSTETGTADPRGSMGLSVGRAVGFDRGHRLPDLFLTHWVAQENAYYLSLFNDESSVLEYRDRTRVMLLGELSVPMVGWGCGFGDLDLDGFPDLVVVNGSTLERSEDPSHLRAEPGFVFWNRDGRMVNVAPGTPLNEDRSARGMALCDWDRDGDIDLVISENGAGITLIENRSQVGASLNLVLEASDYLRFGARVCVTTVHTQIQWFGGDVSYLSQHSSELIFGLGQAKTAHGSIRWADGLAMDLGNLHPGTYRVTRDAVIEVPDRQE